MPPLPPITQALLIANVVVFCLDLIMGQMFTHWFALRPIGHGFMPWQVVTYAFAHGSLGHVFFNMIGLVTFGAELERLWGQKRFQQYYLVAVLAGAAAQLLLSLLTSSGGPMIGASAGVLGLVAAYGLLFPNRTLMLIIPPMPIKAKVLVVIFVLMDLAAGITGAAPGVAHFAHLGGMLGGWLMIRYWRGQPPFGGFGKGPRRRRF